MTSKELPPIDRRCLRALLAVGIFVVASAAGAAAADNPVWMDVETQAFYTLGPGDSQSIGRRLALFRAKRQAAELAADRFVQQNLIQFVDRDQNELACLVADRLTVDLLEDGCRPDGPAVTCTVRIGTRVTLSDFIDAQLASLRLGVQDTADYRAEMEPEVEKARFSPGQALAKAYWLIDRKEWRRAVIYLDRITRQYPNWPEAYEVKAVALKHENQIDAMRQALQRACALGSQTACADVKQPR